MTIGNMRYVMFYASHCRLSFLGYSPFSQCCDQVLMQRLATNCPLLPAGLCAKWRLGKFRMAPKRNSEDGKQVDLLNGNGSSDGRDFPFWVTSILLVRGAEVVSIALPSAVVKVFVSLCFFFPISFV